MANGIFITENEVKKCCFTGYRPSKMPFLLDSKNKEYNNFENALFKELTNIINLGCTTFYTGMAMGFDIIAAEAVLLLKKINSNQKISLVCVLPFDNQEESFYKEWKIRYYNVLNECDEKVVLSQNYYKGCYQKRNIYMVDNSDCVLTWYDGKAGGTRNTLDYAAKKQRHIFNAYKDETYEFALQTAIEIL